MDVSDGVSDEQAEPPADMLLLNASNYPRVPIFPYAFVQVTAIARRHGLRVRVHDMLGTRPDDLDDELRRLLARHRPRMIGFHLRQLDSLFVDEYRGYRPLDAAQPPFFPVDATADLIARVRRLTDAPVVVGGHGFTSSPRAVFARLQPDFAVVGEPDAFFARFADVLERRRLDEVANLMHAHGANERVYFPPAAAPEYTDADVVELERFYGVRVARQQAIPVEVVRGCPYRCYFCCEPAVKGRRAAARDLDAVLADIERLGAHGLHRVWLVCSELNVLGPELALELAERIVALRERTGWQTRWHAFSLPVKMSEDTWRTLARAGFRGGFNTFLSLDDDNLKRGRIPHRAIDAMREYEIQERVAQEIGDDDFRARGTMALFLGNSYATPATVHTSLRALHERGLLESARVAVVMSATRLFETLDADDARGVNERISFDRRGAAGGDLALPTFEYPRALLDHFGGDRKALEEFFAWIETTLLSRAHESAKDWPLFLANTTAPARLAAWLGGGDDVGALFWPPPHARKAENAQALATLLRLFELHRVGVERVLSHLELDGSSPAAALRQPIYDVLERLYRRFDRTDDVLVDVKRALGVDDDSLEVLFVRFYLHHRNIVIAPAYRAPLFGAAAEPSSSGRRRSALPVLA